MVGIGLFVVTYALERNTLKNKLGWMASIIGEGIDRWESGIRGKAFLR